MAEVKRPLMRGMAEDFRELLAAPRDLWIIYAVKLLESISYFAVLAILILYLHDDLRFSDEMSGLIFGTWGTVVSLLTFLAGFVADAMGQRKALIIAALTAVIGRAMLLGSEVAVLPLTGLIISAWAVASMKPVMTAAIKTHAPAKIRAFAYSIFYVVMNLGAFIANHVVSWLRISLLGRVIRPGEVIDGVGPAPEAARSALTESLIEQFPPEKVVVHSDEAVRAFGRMVTGGRDFEYWTSGDVDLIRAAAEAEALGRELPAAPFGLSGYEMIFAVAAGLAVISLLLLRTLREEKKPALPGGGTGARAVLNQAAKIGVGLFQEKTFWAYLLFICVLVLVRAIFVHAHSTWPTYMLREFGRETPQAMYWSLNPALIVFLTPVIGSMTSRFSAWSVIMTGSFITAASVLCMVVQHPLEAIATSTLGPLFGAALDYRVAGPILFIIILSIGEALWSPRLYEYVAVMAPPGREASYMGLTQLPMFAAKPLVGLMSGFLLASYSPESGARNTELMWTIVFATTLAGPLIALLFAGVIRAAEKERLAQSSSSG